MSTLQLHRLCKSFGDGSPAVTDVDLEIDDGELVVLVGPSGCGKTTVLRMIAGLEAITSGEIRLDGVVVNDVDTNQRDIAMAFQTYALYPHMTVAQNIGFALTAARVPKAILERRVREVAATLRLSDVLHWHPRHLSGGQQQRCALGRAIVREPRLLLMDEPMSHLDSKLRIETRSAICRIQRRLGLTTMHVTHDQAEAMAMGDRVAVMRGGRIVQCGPPMEVYRAPDDLFVAMFIGSPPMTVVRATVVVADEAPALRVGSRIVPLDDAELAGLSNGMIGRDVAVGMRPEAFRRDEAGPLVASVRFVERLGAEQLVHATIDARPVTPTEDGTTSDSEASATVVVSVDAAVDIGIWEPLKLHVDTTQIHLFDLATGDAIRAGR